MTYPLLCTITQLQARYPELLRKSLTDDVDSTTEDPTKEDIALGSASDLIYGYLEGGRYSLPFSTVPGLIVKICADIAWFNLGGRWGEDAKGNPITDQYERCIEMLKEIRGGTLPIYGAIEKIMIVSHIYKPLDIPSTSLATDDTDLDWEKKE